MPLEGDRSSEDQGGPRRRLEELGGSKLMVLQEPH